MATRFRASMWILLRISSLHINNSLYSTLNERVAAAHCQVISRDTILSETLNNTSTVPTEPFPYELTLSNHI